MRLEAPFIQAGRYRKGRRGHSPTIIVVHWSAGWGDAGDIAAYFVDPKKTVTGPDGKPTVVPRDASYHLAIGRGGEVVQMVDTDDTAWHAGGGQDWEGRGRINERSIGVCLANRGPITPKEAARLGDERVFKGAHTKPGFKGYGTLFEAITYEQMETLRDLVGKLKALHPTLTGVCGHEDLVHGKGDPGPAFNVWNPRWSEHGLVRHVKDWRTSVWKPWEVLSG